MLRRRMAAVACFLLLGIGAVDDLHAQAPPLVFTSPAPSSESASQDVRVNPIVAERGLMLWSGGGDFGVGVDLAAPRWTIRSVESMNVLAVNGRARPTFQQLEIISPVLVRPSARIAAGGGVREEWDGTRVLIARGVAGADIASGRLQGSVVFEHALSSPARRDAADMIVTAGWVRRINPHIAIGLEGIAQDLEGFWDAAEADGGARVLAGPSLQLRSPNGAWSASATFGPVIGSASSAPSARAVGDSAGRHFGVFASATWAPSSRR